MISYLPGEREGKLVNRLASSLSLCHSRSFSFTQYACLSLSLSLSFWQSKSHHSFPLRPSSLLSCCGSVFISPSPLISSSRGQGLQEHHHTRLMSLVCVDVVSLSLSFSSMNLFRFSWKKFRRRSSLVPAAAAAPAPLLAPSFPCPVLTRETPVLRLLLHSFLNSMASPFIRDPFCCHRGKGGGDER